MNFQVLICLVLWPCVIFAVTMNHKRYHDASVESNSKDTGGTDHKRYHDASVQSNSKDTGGTDHKRYHDASVQSNSKDTGGTDHKRYHDASVQSNSKDTGGTDHKRYRDASVQSNSKDTSGTDHKRYRDASVQSNSKDTGGTDHKRYHDASVQSNSKASGTDHKRYHDASVQSNSKASGTDHKRYHDASVQSNSKASGTDHKRYHDASVQSNSKASGTDHKRYHDASVQSNSKDTGGTDHKRYHDASVRSNSKDTGGTDHKRDQIPVIFTESSPETFHGIQADSLGANNQVTINSNDEKEAVVKELQDGGGPVFNHDSNHHNNLKGSFGTQSNDMSQYDDEDINLVGTSPSSHRHETPKPVRLPSLTDEGKVDTVIGNSSGKSNDTEENESLKVLNSKSDDHSFGQNTDSVSKGMESEGMESKGMEPKGMESKSKNTKKLPFSKDAVVKIIDLPESKILEDDPHLSKSAKQLLGESDVDSLEKLQKSGERVNMYYDKDINAVKKVEQPSKTAVHGKDEDPRNTMVSIKGGQILGGQVTGGTLLGGQIEGGLISGGIIKGGEIKGGSMSGGLMDGGVLMDGVVEGGFVHNGTIKGGLVKGGNVTGGTITGGIVLGGSVSAGVVAGGTLKTGAVEGGVLRGGIIDGGILKGGVMESGKLLGGTVWNGRVTGGIILGGEILGGEVGEGVVIRGGKINGTVTIGRKRGPAPPVRQVLQQSIFQPGVGAIGGIIPAKQHVSQTTPPANGDINRGFEESPGNDAVVINAKTQNSAPSNFSRPDEEIKRTYEPKDFFNRPPRVDPVAPSNPVRNYGEENYADARSSYSAVNYARSGYQATNTGINPVRNYAATRPFPRPLAIPMPRGRPTGIDINQFVKQVSNGVQRSMTDSNVDVKPDYHWILNQIKDGEVTGTPGKTFVAKGGIRLNRASIGFDGTATYMDGGDYSGTCVSDPNLCPRGLSVEMTIKVDPEATTYRSPRYILDTGASSFNSRGVALYTMDNKLRADVAIRDTAYCLAVPLTTEKWQDVVLTYNKDGELNMYINCKLMTTVENDEQCIICHTPGCHTTDENTKIVLGRANNEPQSNYAKFKAGDLSIYERYLTPQDIDKICGFSKQKPSTSPKSFMPSSPHWRSPVVSSSFPRTQPGFQKSGISSPRKNAQIPTINAPYFSPWSDWSTCTRTCESGTQVRQRSCIFTHAQSGWQTCHGVTFQAKKCTLNCKGQREKIANENTTATQKDDRPDNSDNRFSNKTEDVKSFANSTNTQNTTTSKIELSDLNRTEIITDKQISNGKSKPSRRNRISKILSKLGRLLGRL